MGHLLGFGSVVEAVCLIILDGVWQLAIIAYTLGWGLEIGS